MGSPVVVVPLVRPAALLAHVLETCSHPTTLIVCSTSTDFVQRCADEHMEDDDDDEDNADAMVYTASLLQVAVARHIRVAFVPTVAHLRGFLAAFDLKASRVPPPPAADVLASSGGAPPPTHHGDRVLVVYNFLRLHIETSEWSSQGLSASAAVLVEAGWRAGLDVLVADGGSGRPEEALETSMLNEKMPVLSTGPRRQLQKAGYPLRTERIKSVLSRWFTFRETLKEDRSKLENTAVEEPAVSGNLPGLEEVNESSESEDSDIVEIIAVKELPKTQEQGTEILPTAEKEPVETGVVEEAPQVEEEPVVEKPVEKPVKTFVKDSEDEDDLSDDDVYP